MARRSSIGALPPEARAKLDKRLAEGRLTLDSLVDWLEENGHEISRSALGRYRKNFEAVALHLRQSREVAEAFARELGTVPNDEMGQMLTELVQTLAFKTALGGAEDEAGLAPKDIMQLARALKDLAGTKQISTRLALEIREEERKRVLKEQAEKIDAAKKSGGLSPQAAEDARRVLGFE